MAETDAEERHPGVDEFPHFADDLVERLRVSRPVREHHAVDLQAETVASRRTRRQHDDPGALPDQRAKNVPLDAEVVDRQADLFLAFRLELVRRLAGHLVDQGPSLHRRLPPDFLDELGVGPVAASDQAPHGAVVAQPSHRGSRVDARERRHARRIQVRAQLAVAQSRAARGELADDEPFDPHPVRLLRAVVRPVVADVGLGHDDDLAPVGGVRQDLLVTRHRGVEDDLREAAALDQGLAAEDGAVLENQTTGHRAGSDSSSRTPPALFGWTNCTVAPSAPGPGRSRRRERPPSRSFPSSS